MGLSAMTRLLVTLVALLAANVVCTRQKLFYIYEFSDVLTDTWPKRDVHLSPRSVWKHAFNENEGFGHFYNGTEYFETWQYSSFRLILSRLLRSKYRTRDISKASLFFIPYDSGAECYVDEKGEYRSIGNPAGDDAFAELLKAQPTLSRNGGYDHFYVHSSSLTAHKTSTKMRKIYEFCPNITYLTVEKLPRVYKWIRFLKYIQPIPMASMYHWRAAEGRNSVPALKPIQRKSEIFISFFGSSNTSVPESNILRNRLFQQCKVLNEGSSDESAAYAAARSAYPTMCLFNQFGAGSNRDTADAFGIMAAYEKSVYCLCPPGDTPIRRAIFDAILAGCIPVMFRNIETPYPMDQYDWHLSQEDISHAFIFIDARDIMTMKSKRGKKPDSAVVNYIDTLVSSYSASDIKRRQRALVSVARKLQYSMPPDVRQYGIPSTREPMVVWDPPFKDAVDVILDRMMEKIDTHVPE